MIDLPALARAVGVSSAVSLAAAAWASPASARAPLSVRLREAGVVDAQSIDASLLVKLRNATDASTLGRPVYAAVRECYLQKEAAERLRRASAELQRIDRGKRLLLADCLRPRDVQKRMFALVVGTTRRFYVADPAVGSMHNYGLAIDVTLADEHGGELDMGTPVHHFGPLAEPRHERTFLASGLLTPQQLENRRLLRRVMKLAGFRGISNEWWHFSVLDRKTARTRYRMVETFEE